ncbi:ATP-binding cassette domain-containing protein [Nocardioides sp.]|uniref:ATP-binding cassette domain-containing protein n=1 Tax=Nocardioides sp. TaxID=35761 RepID=UPI0037836498
MSVVEVRGLRVEYDQGGRRRGSSPSSRLAVQDVDLTLDRGEILGIVGESGSGKTSIARCVAGYQTATSGTVSVDGQVLTARRDQRDRRRVQMIFQDPYSSLNPAMTLRQALREPIAVHALRPGPEVDQRVEELMTLVGLDLVHLDAKPRRLSGGQRQRASIARALALEPEVLVADEPVSALDVSVQAVILNLLADLRSTLDMSILFISHDMSVVAHLCDRVAVMTSGRIVETGPVDDVFRSPQHPYTQELLAAVPPHPWSAAGGADTPMPTSTSDH